MVMRWRTVETVVVVVPAGPGLEAQSGLAQRADVVLDGAQLVVSGGRMRNVRDPARVGQELVDGRPSEAGVRKSGDVAADRCRQLDPTRSRTSRITTTAVNILPLDATQKQVSVVFGAFVSRSRGPYASLWTISPCRWTRTAPENSPADVAADNRLTNSATTSESCFRHGPAPFGVGPLSTRNLTIWCGSSGSTSSVTGVK